MQLADERTAHRRSQPEAGADRTGADQLGFTPDTDATHPRHWREPEAVQRLRQGEQQRARAFAGDETPGVVAFAGTVQLIGLLQPFEQVGFKVRIGAGNDAHRIGLRGQQRCRRLQPDEHAGVA